MRLAFAFLLLALTTQAATYHVRKDGNNANAGTATNTAWLTIQKAEDTMVAGDSVTVWPGTYDERIAVSASGTVASQIRYVGLGGDGATNGVICRGFDVSASNIELIGFEITHTASTWSRAVSFSGVTSNTLIAANYIHNTYNEGGAIRAIGSSATNTYVTVRGNTFYHLGFVSGVFEAGNSMAVQTEEWHHHWLVEYNIIQRAGDFVDMDSHNSVIRNNWIHDYSDSYWTGGGAGHADTFQPFSISNQVYESNMAGDNRELNSHYLQIRQNDTHGTNLLFRGNIGYNFGSYIAQLSGADRLRLYNNTFYDMSNVSGDTPVGFDEEATGGPAIDGLFLNNIIHTSGGSVLVTFCATCAAEVGTNLSYNAPTTGGGVTITSDPLFTDASAKQFWLGASSPAIGNGRALMRVAEADGSGTDFDVTQAKDLTDGFGIVQADWLVVDGNSAVQIVSISGSNLTVSSSITWTNGAGVYWGLDSTPDLGAYPYGHTPLGSATYTSDGVVTPNGDTRCVRQYRNGIEIASDFSAPYSFTHSDGDVYRAFALYASTNPVVAASASESQPSPAASSRPARFRGIRFR
jgi:hypothetical protein